MFFVFLRAGRGKHRGGSYMAVDLLGEEGISASTPGGQVETPSQIATPRKACSGQDPGCSDLGRFYFTGSEADTLKSHPQSRRG